MAANPDDHEPPTTAAGGRSDTSRRPAAHRLTRHRGDRMVAGVAGGLAEYLDLDVALIRVGLIALCCVGGLGAALYGAAWLLVPEEGSDGTLADELMDRLGGQHACGGSAR
jgi:phage shock protein PspC (stress-responsive transcriptional regulator)